MGTRNIAAGIDLNREETQICYYNLETGDTVTAPMKIGNEEVSFRSILDECEMQEDSFAEDAEQKAQKQRRLEEQASDMFRQALATLGLTDPARQLKGLVVTMPQISVPVIALLRAVCGRLGLDESRAFLQDYCESFYYHTFYQKKELHARGAGLFRFRGEQVTFYSLSQNPLTRPVTVTAVQNDPVSLGADPAAWDQRFCALAEEALRGGLYSSIYIMGDAFEQSLMPHATAFLCKNGRKVFVVDRLFARGACYAAREKTLESILNGYLFLGDDLVRSNIGMRMLIQGTETWYPIVSAGVNWYAAGTSFSCLLAGEPELVFAVSAMDGSSRGEKRIDLSGIPKRPPKTTRLDVSLTFVSAGHCTVEVKDAGFGELFPSSHMVWREEWEDV